jgi:integral membrane sensor domain MASE1
MVSHRHYDGGVLPPRRKNVAGHCAGLFVRQYSASWMLFRGVVKLSYTVINIIEAVIGACCCANCSLVQPAAKSERLGRLAIGSALVPPLMGGIGSCWCPETLRNFWSGYCQKPLAHWHWCH